MAKIPTSDSVLLRIIKIDSLCKLTDTSDNLSWNLMEGNTKEEEGLNFSIYLYFNSKTTLVKIKYDAYGDDESHLVYYYYNDKLIKIQTESSAYYKIGDKFCTRN